MSLKNKLEVKAYRRDDRAARPYPERRPASDIDLESSAHVLGDCKQKLSARSRKWLMRCRANLLVMPTLAAKLPAVKLAEKLESLTLVQLGRRRSQFARRAAGAKYKLAALSPDSRFRPPLQRVQDANLFALKQANAEIEVRTAIYRQPDGN